MAEKQLRTLSLSDEHITRLASLMEKFMRVSYLYEHGETLDYTDEEGNPQNNNWLYITMVLLPQYIGDWHLDANWMVTHMTAKTFKHPIDYLYEKYIDEEK